MEKTEGIHLENIGRVFKGSLIAIAMTIVALVLFAAILTYTSVGESLMFPVTIGITVISICISSLLMARKIKKNGIVYGGVIRIYGHVTTLFIIQHNWKWIYAKYPFYYLNSKCHCLWHVRRNDRSKYIEENSTFLEIFLKMVAIFFILG